MDGYGKFSIQIEFFIHSLDVRGTGLFRLAVLFQLRVRALVVTALLRESWTHGVLGIVLPTVGEGLVVSATVARKEQGVAQTLGAQPQQGPLVRYTADSVEQGEQHQTQQDYRPSSAPSGRHRAVSWHSSTLERTNRVEIL